MVLVQEYKSPNLTLTPLMPLFVISKLAFLLASLLGLSHGCYILVLKPTLLFFPLSPICPIYFINIIFFCIDGIDVFVKNMNVIIKSQCLIFSMECQPLLDTRLNQSHL